MEKSIGMYLEKDPYQHSKDEIVHHVNENPSDNSLSNLKLMSHGDHTRLHRRKK